MHHNWASFAELLQVEKMHK